MPPSNKWIKQPFLFEKKWKIEKKKLLFSFDLRVYVSKCELGYFLVVSGWMNEANGKQNEEQNWIGIFRQLGHSIIMSSA